MGPPPDVEHSTTVNMQAERMDPAMNTHLLICRNFLVAHGSDGEGSDMVLGLKVEADATQQTSPNPLYTGCLRPNMVRYRPRVRETGLSRILRGGKSERTVNVPSSRMSR